MFGIKELVDKIISKIIDPIRNKIESYYMSSYACIEINDDHKCNLMRSMICYEQKTKDQIPGIDIINSHNTCRNNNIHKDNNSNIIETINKADSDENNDKVITKIADANLIDLNTKNNDIKNTQLQEIQTARTNNENFEFANLSIWENTSFEEDCNNCLSDHEMRMSFVLENSESLEYSVLKQTLKDQNKLIDNLQAKIEQLEKRQRIAKNRIVTLEQELLLSTDRLETFKNIALEKISNLETENNRLRLLYDAEKMTSLCETKIPEAVSYDVIDSKHLSFDRNLE